MHDFDSIRMNPLPSQCCHLSDSQRTDDNQCNDGFRWFGQRIDHTAYVLFCKNNGRLPGFLVRQTENFDKALDAQRVYMDRLLKRKPASESTQWSRRVGIGLEIWRAELPAIPKWLHRRNLKLLGRSETPRGPQRVLVSPISIHRFFSGRGYAVLESELLWICVPASLFAAVMLIRRRSETVEAPTD
jgi:hypothetical protein